MLKETMTLAPREKESLEYAAAGFSNRETAFFMKISERTVESYIRSAMARLGATNKTDAVWQAHELGLLNRDKIRRLRENLVN